MTIELFDEYPDPISEYLADAIPRVKARQEATWRKLGIIPPNNFTGITYITRTYTNSNIVLDSLTERQADLYDHLVRRWLREDNGN